MISFELEEEQEIAREALLLVSCSCGGKLHPTEQPLEFDPVCPTCAARSSIMRSLEI